jgi:hypothetical protein
VDTDFPRNFANSTNSNCSTVFVVSKNLAQTDKRLLRDISHSYFYVLFHELLLCFIMLVLRK